MTPLGPPVRNKANFLPRPRRGKSLVEKELQRIGPAEGSGKSKANPLDLQADARDTGDVVWRRDLCGLGVSLLLSSAAPAGV
jgi:hypothetical protein